MVPVGEFNAFCSCGASLEKPLPTGQGEESRKSASCRDGFVWNFSIGPLKKAFSAHVTLAQTRVSLEMKSRYFDKSGASSASTISGMRKQYISQQLFIAMNIRQRGVKCSTSKY
jgi:hypothetical protein